MARWRNVFVTEECNPKRNAFWSYVDRTCSSQVLAKAVINVGGGAAPHLSSAIAAIMDVKLSRQHAALIAENRNSYDDVAAVARKRVKYLKYRIKRAQELRYSARLHYTRTDLGEKLLSEFNSGCLHSCLREAEETHTHFKRKFTDIFAAVSEVSKHPVVLVERPSKRNEGCLHAKRHDKKYEH